MPQMLLILLAIVVLALYSFGRQADNLRTQEIAIEREIEVAMMDVKAVWESYMQSKAFAEEIANGSLVQGAGFDSTHVPSLVQPMGPDLGETSPSEFDDFDDFKGYSTSNYLFPVRGMDTPFTVEVLDVWYYPNGTPSTTKAAQIRVTYVNPRRDQENLPFEDKEKIQLEQIALFSINSN